MLYAYVDGIRRRAEKGLTGLCKCCDDTVKAFCGEYVTHHWKHRPGSSCSFAGKGESEWHLAWKAKFPEAWQEVIFTDEHTGVKHIADVCTPNGVAIEFQNSTILPEELRQRESFYTKLVWVVNADNFDITFESEAERTIRRMYRGKHEFNHMQDYNTKQEIEQIKAKIRKVKRETELKKDVIGSLENNVKHWQKRKDAFEADKTFGSELKKSGRLPSLKELHAATSLDSSVWIFGKDYGKFQAILTDLEHQQEKGEIFFNAYSNPSQEFTLLTPEIAKSIAKAGLAGAVFCLKNTEVSTLFAKREPVGSAEFMEYLLRRNDFTLYLSQEQYKELGTKWRASIQERLLEAKANVDTALQTWQETCQVFFQEGLQKAQSDLVKAEKEYEEIAMSADHNIMEYEIEIEGLRQSHEHDTQYLSTELSRKASEIRRNNNNRFHLNWKRKREVWFDANAHVFLDKGGALYRLLSETSVKKYNYKAFLDHYSQQQQKPK